MKIVNTLSITELSSPAILELVKKEQAEIWLADIVGKSAGTKIAKVPNKDGSFATKLTGEFYARTADQEFTANVCILPRSVHQQVVDLLANDETGGGVEFAFSIGVKPTKRDIPYEYTVNTLMPVKFSKPLEGLMAMLPTRGTVAQIEAPAVTGPEGPHVAATVTDKKKKAA